MLERFIDLFGTAQIEWLSADREFIGREWWAYLQAKGIVFYIRIRHHLHIEREGKKLMHASHLFKRLVVGQAWLYPKAVIIGGVVVYLTAKKIPTQHDRWEWLIVASNQAAPDAFEQYAQRWQIETMFKALKTNGFNFEDTHIKHDERLDQLMMVLALTFVWAYKMGIYKHTHLKAITKKAHGRMAHSCSTMAWICSSKSFAIPTTLLMKWFLSSDFSATNPLLTNSSFCRVLRPIF